MLSSSNPPPTDRVNPLLLAPLVFSAVAVSSVILYSLLPSQESELERLASGLPPTKPLASSGSSSLLLHSASANTIRNESSLRHFQQPRLTVGEKVDREQLQARYAIDTSTNRKITVIGKGAYGRVLSAKQLGASGHSRVAMKVVSPQQMSARALSMEVDVLKRVRGHDHIIHLLEVLECQNEWYLVTELCEGGDLLDRLISNGRYEERTCANVLYNVASGLEHVHQCGYIHMDLKPENLVFVSKELTGDDVRIVDFGMARSLYGIEKAGGLNLRSSSPNTSSRYNPASSSSIYNGGDYGHEGTEDGAPAPLPPRVGTVAYWSPEQILAGNAVNDKSQQERLLTSDATKIDVWGLGVIAYIMLFGCHPFDVKGEGNEWQICRNVLRGEPDYEYGGIEISSECKDLLRGLLEFDPNKRLSLEQAMRHPFFRVQQQEEQEEQEQAAARKQPYSIARLPNSWRAAGYAVERTKEDDVIETEAASPRIAPFRTVQASQAVVQAVLLAAVACAEEDDDQFRTPQHLFRAAFDAIDAAHEGVITLSALTRFAKVVKRNVTTTESEQQSLDKASASSSSTSDADHILLAMERAAGRLSFQPRKGRTTTTAAAQEPYLTFDEFVALLRSLSCLSRTFNANDVLFEQGSVPQGVYLLVNGQARVESRRSDAPDTAASATTPRTTKAEEGFAVIPPGAIIGETAIVQGRTERSATIRMTRDGSQVIYIPKHEFLLALASSKVLQEKLFSLTNEQQARRVFQLFDALQVKKETLRFDPGQIIFKQRDQADYLYLVKRGEVELSVEGQATSNNQDRMHVRVGTRKQGDVIGVSAMNVNAKRGTTATAAGGEPVVVDKISSQDLRRLMDLYPILRFFMDSQKRWRNENWQQRLADVERGVSEPQILPVLGEGVEEDAGRAFELYRAELATAPTKEFAKGDYVFSRGDAAGEMFVLESGRCDVEIMRRTGAGGAGGGQQVMTVTTLGPGDHIGEQALLEQQVDYAFSMRCLTPVRVRVLAPAQLHRLLGKPNFQRVTKMLMHQRRHRWVSNLLNLAHETNTPTEFIALNPGDRLFQAGDPIERLCKVLRGTIVITNSEGQEVRTLNPGDTVGWEVFRDKETLSQMTATCVTRSVVEALPIDTLDELVQHNRYVSKELEQFHAELAPEFSSANLMVKRNSNNNLKSNKDRA